MKQVIVLEALKPLMGAEERQGAFSRIIQTLRQGIYRAMRNPFHLCVATGTMAFISATLSMDVTACMLGMASLVFYQIDLRKEQKGGGK